MHWVYRTAVGVVGMASDRVVLPRTVRPVHYDLALQPDLDKRTFTGTVSVHIEVLQDALQTITLNALDLVVSSAKVGALVASDIRYDAKDELALLTFPSALPKGAAVLDMSFSGVLSDKMVGFYASTYEKDGVKKTMAVTQFEAVYARRALPCWDEPALKATFSVHLTVDKGLVAVSNMPAIREEDQGAKVKISFDKTPVMSTYLLAFVIGEFDSIEGKTQDGVLVRIWTPPGKAEQGRFALDASIKILEFYNRYFEIPYPLPKVDQLAIPDFAFGAMENWGCITYRSTALLVDPENSSASSKQYVAIVVAHELAHQWFGNVTSLC